MSITTKYKKLFEVQIWHHYFLNNGNTHYEDMSADDQLKMLRQYDVRNIFYLLPTKDTIQNLNDNRLKLIDTSTGFIVVTPTSPSDPSNPAVDLKSGKFIFALYPRDHKFLNFTNLPLEFRLHNDPKKNDVLRGYYFSNKAQNKVSSHLNLSAPISNFQPNGNYEMGTITSFNGKTYEAREHIQNSPNPTAANSGWIEIKTLGYVSSSDIIRLRQGIVNYVFTAPNITADISVEDENGQVIQIKNELFELVDKVTFTSSPDEMEKAIHISHLPPGKYNLKVANIGNTYVETQTFFYHPQIAFSKPFGVIEIHIQSVGSDYDLLTGGGTLKQPVYDIRFQNRYTKWNYMDKKGLSSVVVTGANQPLPFTDFGKFEIKFNSKSLPNANPGLIKKTSSHWITEVIVDKALLSN